MWHVEPPPRVGTHESVAEVSGTAKWGGLVDQILKCPMGARREHSRWEFGVNDEGRHADGRLGHWVTICAQV